jgi:uncharacterized protein (DUF1501 family)
MGAVPAWLTRAVAAEGKRRKTLVVVFQRGAADGLNIVIPFADPGYKALRPTLAIPAPVAGLNQSFDLDGTFALHGAMQPLKDLWDKQQLAIVEATGSPDSSRSHFDAQDFMESGTSSERLGDGWLNRALPENGGETAGLRAVSIGNQLPRTLRGSRDAIAVNASMEANDANRDATAVMEAMYSTSKDPQWGPAGKNAFAALKLMRSIAKAQAPAPQRTTFALDPGGNFGRALNQLATLIKADAGVEAAFVEIPGWDHHSNESQQLQNILRQFSAGLADFYKSLGDRMEDVVVVTMSEFGRTAAENGNAGTDHGHGSLMFVMGGPVAGGKIYGQWPGLAKEQLFEGRDLAVTTDYRSVLAELLRGHLGQQDMRTVFPGFSPAGPLGLLKA